MSKRNFKNKGITVLAAIGIGLALGGVVIGIIEYFRHGGITGIVLDLLNFIAGIALYATDFLFKQLSQIAAIVVNVFISLNPFGQYGFASILWEFFKNISYVSLVFLALIAGFEWIIGRDDDARKMVFGIILIAFLINFTFILAKEIFTAIWYLQIGILQSAGLQKNLKNTEFSEFGNLLYAALSFVPPSEISKKIEAMAQQIAEQMAEKEGGSVHNIKAAYILSGRLLANVLNVVYSLIMWVFAGISIGRFLIISFLVGILPLVCIAYVTPWYKRHWDNWWKFFINWNVNILILIPLILIGISLIATNTGALREQEIANIFLSYGDLTKTMGPGSLLTDFAIIIALILKFAFIGAYFIFVLILATKLGWVFGDYAYRLGGRLWMAAGLAAAGAGRWLASPALDRMGGGLSKVGDILTKSPFSPLRRLGLRVQDLAESIQKPTRERASEEAKAIWNQIKDKSPEEIARELSRYKGPLQKELAKRAGQELTADQILKLASNLDLAKLDKAVIKNLCASKLNCALTMLTDKSQAGRALPILAQRLQWRDVNLRDLNEVLNRLGYQQDEIKSLAQSLPFFLDRDDQRRFFAHPENLAWLSQNAPDVLAQYQGIIKGTGTYRAFESGVSSILDLAGITDPTLRKQILDNLTGQYSGGKINAGTLREWGGDLEQRLIPQITTSIQDQITTISNTIRQLENQIAQTRQGLGIQTGEDLEEAIRNYLKGRSVGHYDDSKTLEENLDYAISIFEPVKDYRSQTIANNLKQLLELYRQEQQLKDLRKKQNQLQGIAGALQQNINQNQQQIQIILQNLASIFERPTGVSFEPIRTATQTQQQSSQQQQGP